MPAIMSNYIYLIINTITDDKYIFPIRCAIDTIDELDVIDTCTQIKDKVEEYGKENFTAEQLIKMGTEGFGLKTIEYSEEYTAEIVYN